MDGGGRRGAPHSRVAGRKAKGAAKLKFLRSSDDAATHKKFKRFILRGEPRRRPREPRLFPNINSLFSLSPCRLTTGESFSARPDTTQLYTPTLRLSSDGTTARRCLRLATFTPLEKLGAYFAPFHHCGVWPATRVPLFLLFSSLAS